MSNSFEQTITAVLRELFRRRNFWVLVGVVLSAGVLSLGARLPKAYTAYSSIVVEQRNIIGPLMDGVAEQADVIDLASIVRELAFSRRVLEQMIDQYGFVEPDASARERETVMDQITSRADISQRGSNLITIRYTDRNPERAYAVTNMFVEWVLTQSEEARREESVQAFEFIDQQAKAYHEKLVTAEESLKAFRSENADALPESASEVTARASELRRDIEGLELEISELQVREQSLRQQLGGEAALTDALSARARLVTRLTSLYEELDELRLRFLDTYPDVVNIKDQIAELEARLAELGQEDGGPAEGVPMSGYTGGDTLAENRPSAANPLYEQLRNSLSETRTQLDAARARLGQMRVLLERTSERSRRIAESEARLAEMTRDYEVNRDIYQDLLRRRENARLSMNISAENQGIKLRLQEPPVVPQTPTGVRFLHIALASALLVIALPIGTSAAIVQFDPRVRTREEMKDLPVPLLGVIEESPRHRGATRRVLRNVAFVLGILALVVIYAGAAWLTLASES